MIRNQSSQHLNCLRGFPQRWVFVARPLLTLLVFAVALMQVVSVGLTASRDVADHFPNSLWNQSLNAATHVAEHWATQPTAVPRATGEKLNELEPLSGSLATLAANGAIPSFLHREKTHCDLDGHRHHSKTLVSLNVRLQI
ncbi:hypothetical protein [Allorhodopirellula solitaria]|uniref:Uncharacterized protein n=1 Tax=Allorhodopirellula solitaria TaxID=2527987 RepID=A0A5C5YHQ1_9BACT|nr:hypothetical protein [Allorhodopirellula solitaria]TWT74415.1 hypothetical protein CA85_13040 [Allorhodopirellula solitaria]